MANWSWTENYGKIERLYPTSSKTYFRLGGGKTAMNPKNGYYFIPTSHDNYGSLIDLLYLAANQRWKIHARTKEQLSSGGEAETVYLVVDW